MKRENYTLPEQPANNSSYLQTYFGEKGEKFT